MYSPEMSEMWKDVCAQIGWEFAPSKWLTEFLAT